MKTFALALTIAFAVLGGAVALPGSSVAVACEGSHCNVVPKGESEAMHGKSQAGHDAGFDSCESSPVLRGAAVPKPRRIVSEGAGPSERSHVLPLKGE